MFTYLSFFKSKMDYIYHSTLQGNFFIVLLIMSCRNFSYPDLIAKKKGEREIIIVFPILVFFLQLLAMNLPVPPRQPVLLSRGGDHTVV